MPEMREIPADQLTMLRRFANFMSALFGGPVYLVGSALREGNTEPRDWDLRTCLSDEDFALRYDTYQGLTPKGWSALVARWEEERLSGNFSPMYWRWADEMLRYSKMGKRQCFLNIDFQAYPASYWKRYEGHSRLRLDTREEE
jgi:hypothetical protein